MKQMQTIGLAAVMAVAMALTACGGSNGDKNGSASGGGADGGKEPVTINALVLQSEDSDYLEKLTKEKFTPETGITVNFTKQAYGTIATTAVSALSSGSGQFDVIMPYVQMTKTVIDGGWLASFEELADKYSDVPAVKLDEFLQSYQSMYQKDGKTYSLVFQPDTRTLFYNKKMLEENGFAPPTSWDDVLMMAEKLTDKEKNRWGFIAETSQAGWIPHSWFPVFYSNGGKGFDDNNLPQVNTPEAVKATQLYKDLVQKYAPPESRNMTGEEAANYLKNESVAFGLMCTCFWQEGYSSINFPTADGGEARTGTGDPGGWSFSVVKGDKDEAAYRFVQWATSEDVQLEVQLNGRQSPGLTKLWSDERFTAEVPNWKGSLDAVSGAYPFAPYSINPEIYNIMGDSLSAIVTDSTTVEDGLNRAQEQLTKLMKESGLAQ